MDLDQSSPAASHAGGAPTKQTLNAALALVALGVVYGDIGTSPLYAFRACFYGDFGLTVQQHTVLGVLSLFLWTLITVISVKYAWFILKADNQGEGGVLALLALVPEKGAALFSSVSTTTIMIGVLGAALLYADGVLTPAISVLSAVEGLEVAYPALLPHTEGTASPIVLGITIAVLATLFALQRVGTSKIGTLFGPVMSIWFVVIGILGVRGITMHPQVLEAINPVWIYRMALEAPGQTFIVLGGVMLCITGGEALYADLGHFGRRPIQLAWYALVLPALLLNYFGQGAFLIEHIPQLQAAGSDAAAVLEREHNPFFALAPESTRLALVILATSAAVIASQSIITGMFSLTWQAIQLGVLPRFRVVNTSTQGGQVFVPLVNALVGFGCILVVLTFQQSSNLDDAYGLAVSATMAGTTILYGMVMHRHRNWGWFRAGLFLTTFLLIDLLFLSANLIKVPHGGWFTLALGGALAFVMWTWIKGRRILAQRFAKQTLEFDHLLNSLDGHPVHRVEGTAVFLTPLTNGVPPTLMHHLKHNKVLHKQVVIMSIQGARVPYVSEDSCLEVTPLRLGFWRVVARNGFLQPARVPRFLRLAAEHGLEVSEGTTTYILGRSIMTPRGNAKLPMFQKRLFCLLGQVSANNPAQYDIPPGRMVEMGIQIDL